MKKFAILFAFLFPFLFLAASASQGSLSGNGSTGRELETAQLKAVEVTAVDANDTPLDVNTATWAVTSGWEPVPQAFNGLKVMFYAYDPNDANDATFKYKFYVAAYGGSGELVADGNCVVGLSQISHNPETLAAFNGGAADPNYLWVDTLDETIVTKWMGGVTPQNYTGLNQPAAFIFDRQNGARMHCIITDRSSAFLQVWCVAYGY